MAIHYTYPQYKKTNITHVRPIDLDTCEYIMVSFKNNPKLEIIVECGEPTERKDFIFVTFGVEGEEPFLDNAYQKLSKQEIANRLNTLLDNANVTATKYVEIGTIEKLNAKRVTSTKRTCKTTRKTTRKIRR